MILQSRYTKIYVEHVQDSNNVVRERNRVTTCVHSQFMHFTHVIYSRTFQSSSSVASKYQKNLTALDKSVSLRSIQHLHRLPVFRFAQTNGHMFQCDKPLIAIAQHHFGTRLTDSEILGRRTEFVKFRVYSIVHSFNGARWAALAIHH